MVAKAGSRFERWSMSSRYRMRSVLLTSSGSAKRMMSEESVGEGLTAWPCTLLKSCLLSLHRSPVAAPADLSHFVGLAKASVMFASIRLSAILRNASVLSSHSPRWRTSGRTSGIDLIESSRGQGGAESVGRGQSAQVGQHLVDVAGRGHGYALD